MHLASLGEAGEGADRLGWHPLGVTLERKKFVSKFTKNSGKTSSDRWKGAWWHHPGKSKKWQWWAKKSSVFFGKNRGDTLIMLWGGSPVRPLTSISRDAISFFLKVEGFQWYLAQIFTMWVGIVEKVFKVTGSKVIGSKVKVRQRRRWKSRELDNFWVAGWIWAKTYANAVVGRRTD